MPAASSPNRSSTSEVIGYGLYRLGSVLSNVMDFSPRPEVLGSTL
jgi:hypothetical protein